ncbi:hypothetical protein CU254_42080 (plasmid) [Amycolatopsis sp. AA4]|uniref:hypothetical protein n=1 Tax=Amycolatopsis sp. AA4 TaxID=1896961 RepID=UPI0001B56C05|nr:hypothetical protein [Amycolatopsis sp. AA4]ATY17168.1 hypothetical protein CU254_42080 [Amycolatopsis sp. AA4]
MVNVAAADLAGEPWTAPEPAELPEWRARLREYYGTQAGMQGLCTAINSGQATLLPVVPGTEEFSPGVIAAQLLGRLEAETLGGAELYYATADMTSLALAAASTPPAEKATARRLPSPAGLLLFEQPIGGYAERLDTLVGGASFDGNGEVEITTPIVAVSWSSWTPGDIVVEGTRPRWLCQTKSGFEQVPDDFEGIRLTFYASGENKFATLPDDVRVATGPDGRAVSVGDMRRFRAEHGFALPPLVWDNECLLRYGAGFAVPEPDTTDAWTQVVYTAWQLIGQSGTKNPLTETEELPRSRAGRRRDERNGITAGPGVRIVRVHSAHRPSRAAAEQDAAASTGRSAPNWSCRWPVAPYRRNTCLNPRGHAGGDCEHEEKIVPAHIKGPPDKPLRITDTVHLWDRQPEP